MIVGGWIGIVVLQSHTDEELASARARAPRSLAWILAVALVRRWQIRAVVAPGPGWRGLLIVDDGGILGRLTAHGDVEAANGRRLCLPDRPMPELVGAAGRHLGLATPRRYGVHEVVVLEVLAELVLAHHPDVVVRESAGALRLTAGDHELVLDPAGAVVQPAGRGSIVSRWLGGESPAEVAAWLAFELRLHRHAARA